MGKIILSFATSQLIGKAMTFASIAIVFQLLPFLFAWLPGVSMTGTEWNISLLNPLSNAMVFAPKGLRWFVTYFYIDLGITLYMTGYFWGLAKDLVLSGK